MGYWDFNGVKYDDDKKITGYKRIKKDIIYFDEGLFLDFYIIRLFYPNDTYKDIRAYCEHETSSQLTNDEKKLFFIKRLFGQNGLIVKERRNDYIFLGGINRAPNAKERFSRFNISSNGKTMQEIANERIQREIMPHLLRENLSEEWDVLNMDYYFHSGYEEKDEVFKNGLINRFFGREFCSLESTFFKARGFYCEISNLYDSVRSYGNRRGDKVYIIRIPRKYRGECDENGILYPPMPTHKMIEWDEKSVIIPEIIYGVYDISSGIIYKNPYYNLNYNPNGLVYDQETADAVRQVDETWYEFMYSHRNIPFDELKKIDEKKKTFKKICEYYGIPLKGLRNERGIFGRKK